METGAASGPAALGEPGPEQVSGNALTASAYMLRGLTG